MTLADILLPFFPEGPQNAVAMAWLHRWLEDGNEPLADKTAESRLSELLSEKTDGVRFFYNHPPREAILADVLGLTPEVRAAAKARAEELMANGGVRAPRLVMDLCGLSSDWSSHEVLFKAIKRDLLGDEPILPLVLVLEDDQYDKLPRSFDDFGDNLRHERVQDPAQGRERAEVLAGEAATVASTWRHLPTRRWLGVHFDGAQLRYEPAGALEQLRERGQLDELPRLEHDAEGLLEPSEELPAVEPPTHPLELRRLLAVLADEGAAAELGDYPERVAYARALEVKAVSTADERREVAERRERVRIEAELAELVASLGLDVSLADSAQLDKAMVRAGRIPVQPSAWRIGDSIHLVGNQALEAPEHPRLEIHRVEVKPNALQRLMDAAARMTTDDWRADPQLRGTVDELAAGDKDERLLLHHARAGLLLTGALEPAAPTMVEDWKGALTGLLAADPPAAELWVSLDEGPREWLRKRFSIKPWATPWKDSFLEDLDWAHQVQRVPSLIGPILDRSQALSVLVPETTNYHRPARNMRSTRGFQHVPGALVPTDRELATSPEVWLDLVEASPTFGASLDEAHEACCRFQQLMPAAQPTLQSLDANLTRFFEQADLELAGAWLALSRALAQSTAVRLHDGTILLELGGGILASIEVRQHSRAQGSVRGVLELQVELGINHRHKLELQLGGITEQVDTHVAETNGHYGSTTRLGFPLPRGLLILGQGVAAEVHFLASPLLVATRSASSASTLAATAAAAGTQVDDD